TELPPVQTAAEVRVDPPLPVQSVVTEPAAANADNASASHVVQKPQLTRQFKVRPIVNENVEEAPTREAPQVAIPEIEKPKPRESPVNSEPNVALSPHLITPAKSTVPKGKVIQWP